MPDGSIDQNAHPHMGTHIWTIVSVILTQQLVHTHLLKSDNAIKQNPQLHMGRDWEAFVSAFLTT